MRLNDTSLNPNISFPGARLEPVNPTILEEAVDLRKPNIERLLKAFAIKIPDRVPVLEIAVFSPTLEYVMGRNLSGGLAGGHSTTDLIVYEKTAGEKATSPQLVSQQAMALSTITITPEEYVEFCQRASFDAMVVQLTWTGLHSFISTRGEFADWPDLERMVPPPDMGFVRQHLQRYIDAARGTGIGVAAWVHSCFARTYEALGFENFALKLYDDPKLVEHVMNIFTNYAAAVVETVAGMDISFFWFADDLADSRGTMISPRIIEQLWLPRTERILAPLKAKGIPIVYHCDGNLTDVIPLALRLGVNAIQPIQCNCNDIFAIKKKYGDRLCLIGNLDVAGPLAFGTPEEAMADAKAHIEALAPGGGYVLCSSHTITSAVKPENFVAMVEAAIKYGVYGA